MIKNRKRNRRKVPLLKRLAHGGKKVAIAINSVLRVTLVIALAIALPVGIYQGYHAVIRSTYFEVTAVRIDGLDRLSRQEVLELVHLDGRASIFGLDEEWAENQLLENPWVLSANVTRELPRTVRIEIEEREAVGWLYWDGLWQVDAEGAAIVEGSPTQVDGPVITGIEPVPAAQDSGASANRILTALSLVRAYNASSYAEADPISEVHFDELVGYSLLTATNELEIRLGQDRFDERMARLEDVLHAMAGQSMAERYILLDGDGELTRVAVGPARPGRGVSETDRANEQRLR
ncbi:MAG: FtsQ-type POTRA domain-containing protein [Myxococcales bacterium]|nr:FtsQ-type POTRA domain-containing protein [Myxococcales bacterium]